MHRLSIALAAYVLLGILAWSTLSETRIRMAALALLGLFAVRTWLHRDRGLEADGDRDKR